MTGGSEPRASSAPGELAPELELATPEGRPISLAAATTVGPVLLAFFKVGCPTCQLTFPYLEKFHRAYADRGLTTFGVSQDDAESTVRFALEKGDTFRMLLDPAPYAASVRWGIQSVPSLFLVGTDGRVWEALTGWSRAEMNSLSETVARMVGAPAAVISEPSDGSPPWKPG